MDGETIIENVQTDAAVTVASAVVSEVNHETAVVVSEVIAVSDQLEAHSEQSEDRHVEILEEIETWQNAYQSLLSNLTTIQSSLNLLASTMAAQQLLILSNLEQLMNRNSLTDSRPSILEAEPIAIVEPAAVVEDLQEAETPPVRKRRVRTI